MTVRRWLAIPLLMAAGTLLAQPAPDRAGIVADLLVAADRADGRGARRELTRAVVALDRFGARSEDAAAAAALDGWRRQVSGAIIPDRGRVLGPAFRRGWLAAGGVMRVEQLFLAGQDANVAVAATPGQGVQLAVTGPDAPGSMCPPRLPLDSDLHAALHDYPAQHRPRQCALLSGGGLSRVQPPHGPTKRPL